MKVTFKHDFRLDINRGTWFNRFDDFLWSKDTRFFKILTIIPRIVNLLFLQPLLYKRVIIFYKDKEYKVNEDFQSLKFKEGEIYHIYGEDVLKQNPKLIKYKNDYSFQNYIVDNNSFPIHSFFFYNQKESRKNKLERIKNLEN